MSKPPPPNGQIASARAIAEAIVDDATRRHEIAQLQADPEAQRIVRVRAAMAREAHDARVAANVAAALAQAWRDELARPPRAPRRPGEGEVPAERFGPGDRRVGSERK